MEKNVTGLMYDEQMTKHRCLWDPDYPECPERFVNIIERCKQLNLIERCKILHPRNAELNEILKKHTQEHYDSLQSTSNFTDEVKMEEYCSKYAAIYMHPTTFDLALLAAGSTIEMVDNILSNKIRNGMAIIRPPGHHAMKSEICGFCYFNNVALAAQNALDNRGIKRILIVDWDIHHGQATQQMFYDDPRVVYFSIHRFEHGLFWPWLRESDFDNVGSGRGRGYNVNVPLNKIGMTNADYLAIFQQILIPLAMEFQPELVIVSAGYDSALGDPEGKMEVTPACYSHLISLLSSLANGKIAVVLEGGYCLQSLAEGAALTLKTLLGDPCPTLIEPLESPSTSITETILNCIYSLRPYWKSLRVNATYDECDTLMGKQNHLHQVIQSFEYNKPYPQIWPTRAFYQRNNGVATERLNKLINDTSLNVSRNRLCYAIELKLEGDERLVGLDDKGETIKRMKKLLPSVHERLTETPMNEVDLAVKEETDPLLKVVDEVLHGLSRSGICIAESYHINGNDKVATAAQYSINNHGLKRVLIVDWNFFDHNSSTQNMFYESSQILCMSVHGPSITSNNGDISMTGKDGGAGFNVNVKLNQEKVGNMEYVAVFNRIILPIAYEFAPELVIVSSGSGLGTDSNNPLEINNVTSEAYSYLVNWLSCLANGRLIICFDNSFDSAIISECIKSLLGDPLPTLPISNDDLSYGCVESIQNVLSVQEKYWSALKFNKKLPKNEHS